MKFWLNSKYRKCPTRIIAEHVGGDIIVIVGMALATSDTVLCRIRVCLGKDGVYAILVGPCMRVACRSRTKQARVSARPSNARMF